MGNTPSRSSTQSHQQSTSSTSASPPIAPPRAPTSSSRNPNYRRNSLQTSSLAIKTTPISHESCFVARPRQDVLLEPQYAPTRRESIAEVIPESYISRSRNREKVIHEPTTLKPFPTPPTIEQPPPTFLDISYTANEDSSSQKLVNRPSHAIDGICHMQGSVGSTQSMNDAELPECDRRAIPTVVQWPHDGDKVYLTGTFCAWAKKYRLARESSDCEMSAVVPIPPGTHHVKFLVDGEMRTSQAMPTAVDDTGILVNYLEVSVDDILPSNHQLVNSQEIVNDPSSEHISIPALASTKCYTHQIPTYLRDFVEVTTESSDDSRAVATYIEDIPPPPSLPMMLQKVILNANSQMKDDASVLTIPNHAVLNHLATSSIKNQILAVSATTRYKMKYVTTLLYKSASSS